MKLFYSSFLVFLIGCSNGSQAIVSDFKSQSEYELNRIKLGENVDSLNRIFKKNMIVQNYRDISDLSACENSKSIIVDDTLTNVDVNGEGIITLIGSTNPNYIDVNGVSVGQDEKVIQSLMPNVKSEKVYSGDDAIDFYEYKIQMKSKGGYYSYIIDNYGKIDSITIYANDHIVCFED